jgi:ankyrin repeat protein
MTQVANFSSALTSVIAGWSSRPISTVCAVVETIVSAAPDLLNMDDGPDRPTALFSALRATAPLELVSTLLKLGADLSATNRNRETPLHVAIRRGVTPEVILAILQADPSAALAEDAENCTPLHVFVSVRKYWNETDLMEQVIAAAPTAVSAIDGDQETPLTIAIRRGAPRAMISRLLKVVPRSMLGMQLENSGVMQSSSLARDAALRTLLEGEIAAASAAELEGESRNFAGTAELESECGRAGYLHVGPELYLKGSLRAASFPLSLRSCIAEGWIA